MNGIECHLLNHMRQIKNNRSRNRQCKRASGRFYGIQRKNIKMKGTLSRSWTYSRRIEDFLEFHQPGQNQTTNEHEKFWCNKLQSTVMTRYSYWKQIWRRPFKERNDSPFKCLTGTRTAQKAIWHKMYHFPDRSGAVVLQHRICAGAGFVFEQPIRYGFCAGTNTVYRA